MKGVAKKRICVAHRHKQQCGDGQREGWGRGWVEVGKGGENGDVCNSVNNKIKVKNKTQLQYKIFNHPALSPNSSLCFFPYFLSLSTESAYFHVCFSH